MQTFLRSSILVVSYEERGQPLVKREGMCRRGRGEGSAVRGGQVLQLGYTAGSGQHKSRGKQSPEGCGPNIKYSGADLLHSSVRVLCACHNESP